MNITTFNRILPTLIKHKLTPWLWGYHGKGKSQTVENFYKSRGWLVFNFRLNCMADVGDFLGLQDFQTNPKTGQKEATVFCMPDWLRKAMDFCENNPDKRACIFIDEINRASRMDLIGPIFQMALDKKLHTYDFSHLNIDIMTASNPDTGNYSGILSLEDKALLSRFVHINFNPSLDEWRDYAISQKYDTSIIDFIQEQPGFLEEKDLESFSITDFAKPDRRKWEAVNKILQENLSKDDQFEVLVGLIGQEAAAALNKFMNRDDKPITLEEIFKYSSKTKQRVKQAIEKNRTDVLNNANQKVLDFFKAGEKIANKAASNLLDYMEDIPLALMYNLARQIYKDRYMQEFVENNPDKRERFLKRLYEARAKVREKEEEKKTEEV